MQLVNAQKRMRLLIGIAGMMLPILVLIKSDIDLPSISDSYYTRGGIFFIAILSALILALFGYAGYKKGTELISDDLITTFAAVCLLITVFIPTKCESQVAGLSCFCDTEYLLGHVSGRRGLWHLLFAGAFILSLGVMSLTNFSRTPIIWRKYFFRAMGIIIILSVLIIVFIMMNESLEQKYPNYVFWWEFVAVEAFGIAWIMKAVSQKNIDTLKNKASKIF